ncbi:MAG TPA: ABC transporter ATP-binding protein [Bryobacteraceae bacterium]|nr:ABC transporter ATP-binding protein [Bryobacteraceae bacterium]
MIDLQFENVSKRYRVQGEAQPKGSGLLSRIRSSAGGKKDFWALRDVSFSVKRGESLGIIGHNGAGKSTILKLLSNITAPSRGKIRINGRLSALLEVGSGFHPELTGRENTYLSGSILGMRRSEITSKMESIIDFAGVRRFIDIPVKRYSSGMYVRLGFSIAAHLDPDILLLDEVLAVGDLGFQEKCKKRIMELHEQGTTLVFISHDLSAVRSLCQRVILMQQGQIIGEGTADEVIQQYTEQASFHSKPQIRGEARLAEIVNVAFYDKEGNRATSFSTGGPLTARLEYLVHKPISEGAVSLYFMNIDGGIATQWTTSLSGSSIRMEHGRRSVEFSCEELGLQPGVYSIDANIEISGTREEVEWQHGCTSIHVDSDKELRGQFYMPHTWREPAESEAISETEVPAASRL